VLLGLFYWGFRSWVRTQVPPSDAIEVRVTAFKWGWEFQYPRHGLSFPYLTVPLNKPVKLIMSSKDVIHSFFVPAFRIKKDAVPGRYNVAWFRATKLGSYHIFCAEYCGTEHARMGGSVIVMEPEAYQTWLAGGPPPESPVKAGEKLFTELNCITCHRPDSAGRGPLLTGVFGRRVQLASGDSVVADEAYLRESIVNPAAKVVAGYQPVMPTFQGQVSEEQLIALVAYIQSLQVPAEGAPAPAGAPQR
jgi:cytochrome c oxidase subunit 2